MMNTLCRLRHFLMIQAVQSIIIFLFLLFFYFEILLGWAKEFYLTSNYILLIHAKLPGLLSNLAILV